MEELQMFFAAYSPIIMIAVMYLAFYFFLVRPQKAEKARREEMLNSLHKGNKVVTVGGIYGEILSIKDNIIDLKVADEVVIRVARTAVGSNLTQGKAAKAADSDEKVAAE